MPKSAGWTGPLINELSRPLRCAKKDYEFINILATTNISVLSESVVFSSILI